MGGGKRKEVRGEMGAKTSGEGRVGLITPAIFASCLSAQGVACLTEKDLPGPIPDQAPALSFTLCW